MTKSVECANSNARCWNGRIFLALRSVLETGASREAEILVLRQQLLVLKRKRPRARLRNLDRLILVWVCRLFPSLLDAMVIVKPETVLGWHRRGFRAYWRWKSRRCGGRPRIDSEIRVLIRRMSRENPLGGAPRIYGELLMLGFEVSESTVGRYICSRRVDLVRRAGRRFYAITSPGSLLSISSWSGLSRSSCFMVW